MTRLSQIVVYHALSLALCLPLLTAAPFMGGDSEGGVRWACFAAAIVYLIICVSGKPEPVYSAVNKLGLERRIFKCSLITVVLILVSVPLLDMGSRLASATGFVILFLAVISFLVGVTWAYKIGRE